MRIPQDVLRHRKHDVAQPIAEAVHAPWQQGRRGCKHTMPSGSTHAIGVSAPHGPPSTMLLHICSVSCAVHAPSAARSCTVPQYRQYALYRSLLLDDQDEMRAP